MRFIFFDREITVFPACRSRDVVCVKIYDILKGEPMTDEEYAQLVSLTSSHFLLADRKNPFYHRSVLNLLYMFENKRHPGLIFKIRSFLSGQRVPFPCNLEGIFMPTFLLILLLKISLPLLLHIDSYG